MSSQPDHNWRPDVADAVAPRYDRLGRRLPHRIGVLTLMRAIPGLREQFSEVPPEYWGDDVTDENYTCAVVSCPCGREPRVEIGLIASCDGCTRVFYYAGGAVYVANSPKRLPSDESSPSSDGASDPPGA